jgi:tRNA threonylcarbamoyladenosine biosynthesis protein TsaB
MTAASAPKPVSDPFDGYALALETSSFYGAIAVGRGEEVLAARRLDRARQHATDLLPAIAEMCAGLGVAPADLAAVYVSQGPGSFTGLRIGITIARTLALAHGALIRGVPTLEVIAQNAREAATPPARVVVITDAKRGNVYSAVFEQVDSADGAIAGSKDGKAEAPRPGRRILYQPVLKAAERATAPLLAAQPPGTAVIGTGVEDHREAVEASGLPILPAELYHPRGEVLYELGRRLAASDGWQDPRTLVPDYVRRPEAEEKWEQRYGRPAS